MSELRTIHLETAAIFDTEQRVLLAEGQNYGWELPGTKVDGGDPLEALSCALVEKLGIRVIPIDQSLERSLPRLAEVTLSVAGVDFDARIRRITAYHGRPMETVSSGYRQTQWVNPLKRGLSRMALSPVAEYFCALVSDNPGMLTGANHVQ